MEGQIVAVVKIGSEYRWYRSDRELWVLDLKKWEKDFIDAGYDVPESDPDERFGITIVDQNSAGRFLNEMRRFQVDRSTLTDELVKRFPTATSWWDVQDLFPIIFVDFETKKVLAFYPEGIPMERYVPDGWEGRFEDFLNEQGSSFPDAEKFWVRDGVDMLEELNARGERLDETS